MRFAGHLLLLLALGFSSCRTVPEMPANIPPTADGYKKVMEDKLGSIWYRMVASNQNEMNVGTVKLTFEVPAAGGRVRNLKVISNSGGAVDERIARGAVEQLRLPAIPAAILEPEHKDYLVCEESFTIFENPSPSPSPRKR